MLNNLLLWGYGKIHFKLKHYHETIMNYNLNIKHHNSIIVIKFSLYKCILPKLISDESGGKEYVN